MVFLQTTQSSSVRAEIVTEEFSTLNPFIYAQGTCSQPYKGNLHQTIVIFRLLGVLLTIIAWFPFKTTQPGSVRAEIATQSILL